MAVELFSCFLLCSRPSTSAIPWCSKIPSRGPSTASLWPDSNLSPPTIAEGSQDNSSHDDHAEDQGAQQSFPFVFTCALD